MSTADITRGRTMTATDTIWVEQISLIDRIPRSVAMIGLFVAFVGLWQLVTMLGLVSPILLPTPMETARDLVLVGTNLITGQYMLGALWITTT